MVEIEHAEILERGGVAHHVPLPLLIQLMFRRTHRFDARRKNQAKHLARYVAAKPPPTKDLVERVLGEIQKHVLIVTLIENADS